MDTKELATGGPVMLNLGCGSVFHPSWVNLDLRSESNDVLACDIRDGIPLESDVCDAVYHSHVLEHLSRDKAIELVSECHRVLKKGGIIRCVVPDLEKTVRTYIELLEQSLEGNEAAQARYEWIMLELLDQLVRNVSGGEMLQYWQQDPMPAEAFVIERCGAEVKNYLKSIRGRTQAFVPGQPSAIEEPLEVGRFRLSGEVHRWMYDRYSLSMLIQRAGFQDIRICRASESRIPGFNSYLLDVDRDGSVRKPDSLFMEALKP